MRGRRKLQEEKQLVTYSKNLRKEELFSPEVLPKRELDADRIDDSTASYMEIDACDQLTDENLSELAINKKQKSTEDQLPSESTSVSSPTNDCSNKDCSPDSGTPGLHHLCIIFLVLILRVMDPNNARALCIKIVNVCGIQLLHFDICFLLRFRSILKPLKKNNSNKTDDYLLFVSPPKKKKKKKTYCS